MSELPPGFVLDQSSPQAQQSSSALPNGFVLDGPQQSSGGVQTIPAADGRPTRVIMNMGGQQQPSALSDAASSFGSGVVKGAAALAGAPSDLSELGAEGIDWLTRQVGQRLGIDIQPRQPQRPKYGSQDIQSAITSVIGDLHEPQTRIGKYAQAIGEFVPGSLIGPGGVVARTAQTVIPAVASEAAGEATQGTPYEGVARFGGALAGGGLTALASRPGAAASAIQAQLPDGITPQMVSGAESLIQSAAARGVDLSWPEALSQVAGRPVLTNTLRHLEGAPQTESRMAEFFGNRPQQVQGAVGRELQNIAPANTAPSTIGPAVGQAAEGTINDVRGAINKVAKPSYDSSATVRLSPQDMARVEALPGYQEARNAVRNDPQLNRYVAQLPDDSVGFLNEVKKYLDTAGQNAAAPVNAQRNMQRAAGYGSDASAVRNAAVNASPDYGAALAVESVGREKYLQPLIDGPLGKIASKDTTTRDAINALFPQNPLPNSEHEISTAVSALAKRNPKAASDLVRAHVQSVFDSSAKDLQSGANQAGGAKFRTQLVGNPQQRLNLREAVEALPNGSEKWRGFNNLLDVLEATGTRQNIGSRTAYNAELFKEQSRSGLPVEATKAAANPIKGAQFLADKYERYKLGSNLNELANILTDPRSGDLLRSLTKQSVTSNQARAIASRLISSYAVSGGVDKSNK